MTVPAVWSDELPRYTLVDGFALGMGDGRLRSQTDTGPGKVRLRSTAVTRPVSAACICDLNQKARLERFWIEDTTFGSQPFLIPDYVNDGAALLDDAGHPLLDDAGERLLISAYWLVLFGDNGPQITAVGVDFRASFTLSIFK